MSLFEVFFIFVYAINIVLGVGVYFTNNKRSINQHYLSLCIIIALWLTFNWLILHATNAQHAEIYVKLATATATLIPASCHILRLAILYPNDSWWKIIFRAKRLLGLCAIIIAICFTPFFIDSVRMPSGESASPEVPEAIYKWGYFVFAAMFIGMVFSLFFSFTRDKKRTEGLQRVELEFIAIGYCAALLTGTVCGVLVTILTGSSQTVPMANASSILALTSIISYGIATKRILGIATILRRVAAYSLLTGYLVMVYLLVWYGVNIALSLTGNPSALPGQILATLVVALTMAPVHGKLQKVTDKLIASKSLNISDTMKKAGVIFQSVTTSGSLLDHFSSLLIKALGTEYVHFYSATELGFFRTYPKPNNSSQDSSHHPIDPEIIKRISETKEPISLDSLSRTKETSSIKEIVNSMKNDNVNLAIGVFSKNKLSSTVLFGPRIDGRIYDKNEQDALQILCNQFAVALENAELYTKMQDSKIQNEIMLDQLISGVVVANPEGEITLFNHEAQRITAIDDKSAIGQNIAILPKEIYLALEVTLENKNGVRNIDAALLPKEGSEESGKYIRMGAAFLFGHDEKPMGALLVFTDVTELKGLEEQVRRTDQLSSVGTLAAGMAHEIKNPLVTIKTFTQLLPTRYSDDDFRNDFSSLVAHEVNRIDGIVNELLSFSKPAKPHLVAMNLQETIDQSLKLIHEQLTQKNITLINNCRAASTHIFGDVKLLSQALINLNLNAIEAIGETGRITFGTLNCSHRFANGDSPDKATTRKCIRLQISDTGKGIERGDLQKIFDPFFTSKSEGTGMGLSVAHGIISEHHGVIEVESEPGRGTSFYLYIPLLEEGAAS